MGTSHLIFQDLVVLLAAAGVAWVLAGFARSERYERPFKRFRRDWLGIVSLVVICLYLLVGVSSLLLLPKRGESGDWMSVLDQFSRNVPRENNYSAPLATTTYTVNNAKPLKGRHLLGTDQLGKDVLFQMLKGCGTSLMIGTLASAIAMPIGIFLGIAAGYYKGRVDDLIQYCYSVVATIPGLILLIALLMVLGKGVFQISFALGITGWVGICRLLRGETLKQSEAVYCQAARAMGQTNTNIIVRHILPNVMHLILINFVLGFSGIVLSEAILSYLSVGVPIGTPSLGVMIDGARMELSRDPSVWWNITAATGALFFLVLSLNLLGDSLRRAFDPKAT